MFKSVHYYKTTEKQMLAKEQGDEVADKHEHASEELIYRIEIPANRYDLLCLEGLAAGLMVFQNKTKQPKYTLANASGSPQILTITSNTAQIRPYAVAAVLRNISFTKDTYAGFIDLQVVFKISTIKDYFLNNLFFF